MVNHGHHRRPWRWKIGACGRTDDPVGRSGFASGAACGGPEFSTNRWCPLGDRVRMSSVDNPDINERVYVRSIATRSSSGSVPLIVEDMAAFLLACGWKRVLIETVGSGQAELRCAAVADRIVVVEGPARGDGIQAEKAGLLELADIVLVNKADLDGAERHAGELRESYALDGEDAPDVMLTSGLKNIGIEQAAAALLELESTGRALRARMRERLLGRHERRLVLHPLTTRLEPTLSGHP